MTTDYFVNPKGFIGNKAAITLKAGGTFNLHIHEADHNSIKGFDDDGVDIHVSLGDIDSLTEI